MNEPTEDEFTWLEFTVLMLALFGAYSLVQNIGNLIFNLLGR